MTVAQAAQQLDAINKLAAESQKNLELAESILQTNRIAIYTNGSVKTFDLDQQDEELKDLFNDLKSNLSEYYCRKGEEKENQFVDAMKKLES